MIKEITLKNFKCFKNLKLPLAPITLLTGLNSMGKSSVVQSLLLLRQSFESGDLAAGRLLLAGELADLGSGGDILYEDAEEDEITFGVDIESNGERKNSLFIANYDRKADRLISEEGVNLTQRIFQSSPPFGGMFQFLSAERWGPRKTLPLSDFHARKKDLGTKGQYTLQNLLESGDLSLSDDDPRLGEAPSHRLTDQIDVWLQEISPGAHLEFEAFRAADIAIAGFKFDRIGDVPSQRFRATNVGFGLSYALPVITALLGSEKGSLIILENPEAHMHPRGQTRLGQLAARAAAAGVQVIAETHSDHFIDGVRIDVRDGRLLPQDVAIHYFVREGIQAVVKSPALDRDGRLSEWPNGFFDQHDENLAKLLAPRG